MYGIPRKLYMIYKENGLSLVSATKFEIAYFKRYLKANDLRLAIVKIKEKKLSEKNRYRVMSFETYIASLGLIFEVGKLVKKENQRWNHKLILILILIQVIVIIILGTYVN